MLSAANFAWIFDQPSVTARAMALSGDTIFLAGYPNYIDEREAYRLPDAPAVQERIKLQEQAVEGRQGGVLWTMSKADGQVVARYRLDTLPVFDGIAVAGESLFVSTVDGRVLCLSSAAADRLPSITAQPDRVAWDQPEDPHYLLPAEVPKNDDFDHVARCKVVESELGYRLVPTAKDKEAIAVKKLQKPITTTATFKTQMRVPSESSGMLINGFLAFGDGMNEAKLIKCGARLRNGRAMLIQGPLDSGKSDGATIDLAVGKLLEIVVTVDLANQRVTYAAGGETITADLERPLKSITHVGYVMDNAVVDFSDVEIHRD